MRVMQIKIERHVAPARLEALGVRSWPTWSRQRSRFAWHYDSEETSYIVRGEVVVTPEGGEPLLIRGGDLVTFPAGLSCHWEIREDLLKHYLL